MKNDDVARTCCNKKRKLLKNEHGNTFHANFVALIKANGISTDFKSIKFFFLKLSNSIS